MSMIVPNFMKPIPCQKSHSQPKSLGVKIPIVPLLRVRQGTEWFSIGPPPSLVFIMQWSWITTLIHYQSKMILYQFGQEKATTLLNRTPDANSRLFNKLPIFHCSILVTQHIEHIQGSSEFFGSFVFHPTFLFEPWVTKERLLRRPCLLF